MERVSDVCDCLHIGVERACRAPNLEIQVLRHLQCLHALTARAVLRAWRRSLSKQIFVLFCCPDVSLALCHVVLRSRVGLVRDLDKSWHGLHCLSGLSLHS